jgi:3-deoxy-D-manno-octulosonate 8-phosphate phosphatase (KDO 8-P phosphatase)
MTEKFHIISDCDGIMTSANITYTVEGKRQKHFSVNDSLIVNFVQDVYGDTFDITVLTGDSGPGLEVTKQRLEYLNVPFVKCKNVKKYAYIKDNYRISNVIYIGDDIYDFAIFRECAFGCTVSNAPQIVKKHAHYVSDYEGGKNGFTDIIFAILYKYCGQAKVEEALMNYILEKEKEYHDDKSNPFKTED